MAVTDTRPERADLLEVPAEVIPVPSASSRARSLQKLLDGAEHEVRDKVRFFLSLDETAPAEHLDVEPHREKVLEWATLLADYGGTATGFPVEYGGEGAPGTAVAGFETLAMGDLSLLVKVGVQFGLFGGAVLHLGNKRQHDELLADIATLRLPGAFAMTESGHGSNVQELETTATYDPATDELVVNTPTETARKEWIGNAARDGRMAAVFAQLVVGGEQHGVHCVLVPLRDEDGTVVDGVRVEDCGMKLGLDGVDNGRLWFDHKRVPRTNLLDRYGTISADGVYSSPIESAGKRFFTMLGTLVQGRVSVAGAGMNAAKVAQVIAVRHAVRRRQFSAPGSDEEALLIDYRVHQRRLLPDIARTYALHFAQDEMRARFDRSFREAEPDDRERRELETWAAGLKALMTWHATHVIQECRECCGGAGYSKANRLAGLKADTDVFTTFEGDNTVLLQLCAKNLLTDFQHEIGELDRFGMVGFLAKTAGTLVGERTGITELLGRLSDEVSPGRGTEGDLLDRDVQRELYRWRAEHIRAGAARRMKGLFDAGTDPFEILVETQDHLLLVARSWAEHLVLDAFAEEVERCQQPELKELLDKLCSLHALWGIEQDRGWFQEHGRLSSTRSKAVLKAVNRLCGELKGDALDLVEAFGVPERQLGDAIHIGEGPSAS